MTCIVGIATEEGVWIGGDSAAVSDFDLNLRSDKKVFTNGDFIMGFEDSFRMGQLLRYALKVPEKGPSKSLSEYMVVDFVDAVRNCLTEGGCISTKDGRDESTGSVIVGYEGRLFVIGDDFQVEEPLDGLAAIGHGEPYAFGALDATLALDPKARVMVALKAAENRSAGVRGPFYVLSQKRVT